MEKEGTGSATRTTAGSLLSLLRSGGGHDRAAVVQGAMGTEAWMDRDGLGLRTRLRCAYAGSNLLTTGTTIVSHADTRHPRLQWKVMACPHQTMQMPQPPEDHRFA